MSESNQEIPCPFSKSADSKNLTEGTGRSNERSKSDQRKTRHVVVVVVMNLVLWEDERYYASNYTRWCKSVGVSCLLMGKPPVMLRWLCLRVQPIDFVSFKTVNPVILG